MHNAYPPRTASASPMADSVLSWDSQRVGRWLHGMGFQSHEAAFVENEISGDILVHLTDEILKEMAIASVGSRIAILSTIYKLKKAHNVAFEHDDYVPASAQFDEQTTKDQAPEKERKNRWSWFESHSQEDGKNSTPNSSSSMRSLQDQVQKLSRDVNKLSTDMVKLREELAPIFKLSREFKHILEKEKKLMASKSSKSSPVLPRRNSTIRSMKVSQSETDLHDRDFDRGYGKGASENENINSPTLLEESANSMGTETIKVYGDRLQNRENESYKSFRISVEDPCAKVLPATLKKYKIDDNWQQYALFITYGDTERCLGYNEKPLLLFNRFREAGYDPVFVLKHIKQVVSPLQRTPNQSNVRLTANFSQLNSSSQAPQLPPFSLLAGDSLLGLSHLSGPDTAGDRGENNNANEILLSETSPAVAVYEYMAQRDDELSIIIGDKLIIRSRSTGWCIVDKSGQIGWVPSGCLLEDSEAEEYNTHGDALKGVALYDYVKIGNNELSIRKGDSLTVFKKYQHWLLAECNSMHGWIPSCYVSVESKSAFEDSKRKESQASTIHPESLSTTHSTSTSNPPQRDGSRNNPKPPPISPAPDSSKRVQFDGDNADASFRIDSLARTSSLAHGTTLSGNDNSSRTTTKTPYDDVPSLPSSGSSTPATTAGNSSATPRPSISRIATAVGVIIEFLMKYKSNIGDMPDRQLALTLQESIAEVLISAKAVAAVTSSHPKYPLVIERLDDLMDSLRTLKKVYRDDLFGQYADMQESFLAESVPLVYEIQKAFAEIVQVLSEDTKQRTATMRGNMLIQAPSPPLPFASSPSPHISTRGRDNTPPPPIPTKSPLHALGPFKFETLETTSTPRDGSIVTDKSAGKDQKSQLRSLAVKERTTVDKSSR